MKRTIIIFAFIGMCISAATTMAQNKVRKPVRQSVHVNGQSGNDQLSRNQNRSSRGVDRDTNHDGRGLINWGDGAPTNQPKATGGRVSNLTDGTSNTMMAGRKESITIGGTRTESRSNIMGEWSTSDGTFNRRANAVTFEGNDEPLWARARRNSTGAATNIGPQVNGNVRPKGFANTTFDDQAARSSQLVQGNQIGTNVRPRRTGLSGDFNDDGRVDAADYLMKGSTQKNNVPAAQRGANRNTVIISTEGGVWK